MYPKNIIPQPGKEVAQELPAGGDKISKSKGTLALWVLTVACVIASISMAGWVDSLKTTIQYEKAANKDCNEKLTKEIQETKQLLMYGVPKLERLESKQDTLERAVQTNAKTYSETRKTLRNEANK